MKRLMSVFVCCALFLSLCACGGGAPSEATDYAKKHQLECLSWEELKEESIVGETYVVYGTISEISYLNYAEGSQLLEDCGSTLDDPSLAKSMQDSFRDTMTYYLYLDGDNILGNHEINYKASNKEYLYLNLNEGDKIAAVVTCEDGTGAGKYRYVLESSSDIIWKQRTSKTTVEEDNPVVMAPKTYPLSSTSSYLGEAVPLDEIIFSTTGSENNLFGEIYKFTGTVKDKGTVEGDPSIDYVVVTTEYGDLSINCQYEWMRESLGEDVFNMLIAEEGADYSLPEVGETATFIVTYCGFSDTLNLPSTTLGANEFIVEQERSERK